MNTLLRYVSGGILLVFFCGCAHLDRDKRSSTKDGVATASPLAKVERLHDEGKYSEALIECVDLSRQDPSLPGLEELRQKIVRAELARRTKSLKHSETDAATMSLEVDEKGLLPATYGLSKASQPASPSSRTPSTPMQQALQQKVTMHLKGADLSGVIDAVARDRNVNIIADSGLGSGKRIDVDVDNVAMMELFDYLARNLGVEFYVGESVVWVTGPTTPARVPMETHIYRLQHGVQFHASDWREGKTSEGQSKSASSKTSESTLQELTWEATEISKKLTPLEDVLKRFVPTVPGADFYFDRGTHSLIVRNTRANLKLIEDLIASMDVVPPQVLIEARFVTASVSDLREIGIEWMLDSGYDLTTQAVGPGGKVLATRTEISKGGNVGYTPYASDASGAFALGPQGPFGELRSGNPNTVSQGLNLTYRGLLTEPMFSAILHALQVSGKGRVLSVPRVTTVNNTPAKLRNGQDLLYFDEFQAQVFNTYDPVSRITQNIGVLIPRG